MRTRLLTLLLPHHPWGQPIARQTAVRRLCAFLNVLALTCLFSFSWHAHAAEPAQVDLAGKAEVRDLRTHASIVYFENEQDDPGLVPNISLDEARKLAGTRNEYTLEEVTERLVLDKPDKPDGDYLLGPFWARLKLGNSGSRTERWRVDAREAYGPSIRVFMTSGNDAQLVLDNRWVTQSMDQRVPQERLVASEIIEIPAGGTIELWIDAEYGFPLDSYLRLASEERFDADRQNDLISSSLIIGARIALLLALIAFAFVLRDRTALYYSGFHTGLLLTTLSQWGFDSFYLGLGEVTSGIAFRLTWAVTVVFYALTVASFLNAREHYPRYARALLLSTVAGLSILPLLSIIDANVYWQWIRPYFEAVIFLQFVLVVGTGIFLALRDKLPGAKWFLFASVMLLILGVMQALYATSALPMTAWEVDASTNLIFAIDGLLFAAALVVRAVEIRQQRDDARFAELDALSQKADLQERLTEAEREYQSAARIAEQHRRQLETTSHDLKQPLLSLQMALSKMEGAQDAAKGVSYIERILRRNQDDGNEVGDEVEQKSGFELAKALHNVTTMFQDEAEGQGIAIRPIRTSARILAEPIILMRILANLVSNAIQHSHGSRIVLGAKRRGDSWDVVVADNGRGISGGDLQAVFARYHKGGGSDGDGIGLAGVQELAEQQGWNVSAHRLAGSGAVFVIEGIEQAAE